MSVLADTRTRSAKPIDKNFRFHDGCGLYLEFRKTGFKYRCLRIQEGGKNTCYTLGQYPGLGLSKARKKAESIKQGKLISVPLSQRPSETLRKNGTPSSSHRNAIIAMKLLFRTMLGTAEVRNGE